MTKLTDTKCRAAKPDAKDYKLSDGSGLYLLVTKHGSKLWRWKYRYNGVEKKLSLGSYPQAQMLDLEDMRALGRTSALLNFFSSSVHIAFAQVWRAERFAHHPKAREEIALVGLEKVLWHFDEVEKLAAQDDWLVGGRFSIADPYLLVFYRWGGLIGIDMRQYPAWGAHKHRMLQRPAVRRALAREDLAVL